MRPGKLAVVLLVACLGQPSLAAATEGADDPSREAVQQAMDSFQAGDYDESLAALQRAYALNPMPRLHYNMSQCYQRLGQPSEELNHLELFLAADPGLGKNPRLTEKVKARIEELRHTLGLDKAVAAAPERPLYKRWWLWTVVGSVGAAGAAGITIGVLASQGQSGPTGTQANLTWTNPNPQTAGFQLRL